MCLRNLDMVILRRWGFDVIYLPAAVLEARITRTEREACSKEICGDCIRFKVSVLVRCFSAD
jgi:hypothetical protein